MFSVFLFTSLASAAVVLSISWLIYDAILVRFEIWTDLSMWLRCGPLMVYSCVVLPRYFMDAVIGNALVGSIGLCIFLNLKNNVLFQLTVREERLRGILSMCFSCICIRQL